MAIWKDTSSRKDPLPPPVPTPAADPLIRPEPELRPVAPPAAQDTGRRPAGREAKESVIAGDLAIEGKITGSGNVRLAGRFKGDVSVEGNLTIEAGAKLTGGVRASTVIVGGELEGNIEAASRVELLETGVLVGDLKAGSLTVAAGSRMRGQAEFGWEEKEKSPTLPKMKLETAVAP